MKRVVQEGNVHMMTRIEINNFTPDIYLHNMCFIIGTHIFHCDHKDYSLQHTFLMAGSNAITFHPLRRIRNTTCVGKVPSPGYLISSLDSEVFIPLSMLR